MLDSRTLLNGLSCRSNIINRRIIVSLLAAALLLLRRRLRHRLPACAATIPEAFSTPTVHNLSGPAAAAVAACGGPAPPPPPLPLAGPLLLPISSAPLHVRIDMEKIVLNQAKLLESSYTGLTGVSHEAFDELTVKGHRTVYSSAAVRAEQVLCRVIHLQEVSIWFFFYFVFFGTLRWG